MINTNYTKFPAEIMTKLISKNMFDMLRPYFDKVKKSTKGKEKEDLYISLQLFLKALTGINSPIRISILNFGTNLLKDAMKDSELSDLKYLIWKYEIMSNYKSLIKESTNCDFLYWSQEIISACFRYFYENPVVNFSN